MPDLNETNDDKILRILKNAKGCLSAQQVTDALHDEQGGGVSYTVDYVEARLSKLPSVRPNGDKYCYCSEHQALLQDEKDAWAAWQSLRDSGNANSTELKRLQDKASDASIRLRQHLDTCPKCN